MSNPTVPIRRTKPPPWHARLAVLRLVVVVLAVAVVAEGLLLARLQTQLNRMVVRIDTAGELARLGLSERPGALLTIAADDLEFTTQELRWLQGQVDSWTAQWVEQQGVEPELAQMLMGVLSSHVSSYGDARLQANLGGIRPEERGGYLHGMQGRLYRTAELLLGRERGQAFTEAFGPAWEGWTAGL